MTPAKIRLWFYGSFLCAFGGYVAYATWMPGSSHSGASRAPTSAESALAVPLRAHVEKLAGDIGPRNAGRPEQLTAARDYLESVLGPLTGDRVTLEIEEVGPAGENAVNLLLDVRGVADGSVVVVGAHYDSCEDSPGANDNGSGVAAVVELAKLFVKLPAAKTVRFAWFANEEPPFFQRPGMGSRVTAKNARNRGERVIAMLALETIGHYQSASGSQRYPWPVGLLYPSEGNFVAFVGDLGSRSLVHEAIRAFRDTTPFPSEGAALPATFPGVDWSDHWSFRQEGYPAIMVTDTAVYRDPNYHETTDTPEKIDYAALSRVTLGLEAVIRRLAR